MASTSSSKNSAAVRQAARAALEGAGAALVGIVVAGALFERRAAAIGIGTAWLASSAGAVALIVARARSPKAFWWAFGAGMALRAAALVGLVVFSVLHPMLSQAVMLVSYALGVLGFLLLEYRHVTIK